MNGQPPLSEQRGTSEAFKGRCHQVRVIESWSFGDVMGPMDRTDHQARSVGLWVWDLRETPDCFRVLPLLLL